MLCNYSITNFGKKVKKKEHLDQNEELGYNKKKGRERWKY